jgi:ActR/RegA family two-component response regulator
VDDDRDFCDVTADELLPKLRQLAPHAAIIVVTGYADMDGALIARRHGAEGSAPLKVAGTLRVP